VTNACKVRTGNGKRGHSTKKEGGKRAKLAVARTMPPAKPVGYRPRVIEMRKSGNFGEEGLKWVRG